MKYKKHTFIIYGLIDFDRLKVRERNSRKNEIRSIRNRLSKIDRELFTELSEVDDLLDKLYDCEDEDLAKLYIFKLSKFKDIVCNIIAIRTISKYFINAYILYNELDELSKVLFKSSVEHLGIDHEFTIVTRSLYLCIRKALRSYNNITSFTGLGIFIDTIKTYKDIYRDLQTEYYTEYRCHDILFVDTLSHTRDAINFRKRIDVPFMVTFSKDNSPELYNYIRHIVKDDTMLNNFKDYIY